MERLAHIHAMLERIARAAVWVGGAALLFAAFMVTIDVLARRFFAISMGGSDEISGYIFAAATSWAYSYVLLNRSNIRIDVVYNILPRAVRAVLDVVALLLLLGFMGTLTRKAIDALVTSWERGSVAITTLATPLWIPQLFWVAGLVLFVITMTFVLLYAVVSLLRGDTATVQKVAGALSVEEEIEVETQTIDVAPSNRGTGG